MPDEDRNCATSTGTQTNEHTTNTDSWVAEQPVKTTPLPADVAENMSRFFGEPIETFDDMISAIRTVTEEDGIAIEDLCHVEGKTPHYAETDNRTYYFRCFYDGIALAHLMDESVEVRTETPTNEPIKMQATPESNISVTPSDAVMSFGVSTNREDPASGVSAPRDVYEAVCPYVRAFRTREDYERWARGVSATTVGIPLESGVPIAAALTANSSTEIA